MKLKKIDPQTLAYLQKVETAIETSIFCDLKDYEYLTFLIQNVPSIRQAAGSVGTFRDQIRKSLMTRSGRQIAGRLSTTVATERASSILKKQTQLDEEIKSTHTNVTTTGKLCMECKATANREKIDTIEQNITNTILKVKGEIVDVNNEKLDEIAAMIELLDIKLEGIIGYIHRYVDELKDHLNKLEELLQTVIEKLEAIQGIIESNKDILEDIQPKINSVKNFASQFQDKYGNKIEKTHQLITEITNLDPRAPFVFEVNGAIPRLLGGQTEILAGLVGISSNAIDVQNPGIASAVGGIATIITLLAGGKIPPDTIKPDLKNFKKIIKEAINEWYEENQNSIEQNIVNKICENSVGESYVKYDSNTTYYPTLLFKFKSVESNEIKRYSQIQIRFLKKPEEIDENRIKSIISKAQSLKNLT